MRKIKKKFKGIKSRKKVKSGDKLKHKPDYEGIVIKPKLKHIPLKKLKPIKIKPKLGRWCEYYSGRLPYPSECSFNKSMPVSRLFNSGKITIMHDRSNCVKCKRAPQFIPWKHGDWDKIKEAIEKGEDLTDMDPPMDKRK